jgi:hypothetical protein
VVGEQANGHLAQEEYAMTTFTQEAEQAFTEGLTACDRALATNNQEHKLDGMAAAIQDICFGLVS